MIKIIQLTHGISINGNSYPNNTLSFAIKGSNIVISLITNSNTKLFDVVYSDFINSNDQSYITAQAVVDDLLLNNVVPNAPQLTLDQLAAINNAPDLSGINPIASTKQLINPILDLLSSEISIDAQANYNATTSTLTIPISAANQKVARIKLTTEIQGVVVSNGAGGTLPVVGEAITITDGGSNTFIAKIAAVTNTTHFNVSELPTGIAVIDNTYTYTTTGGASGNITSLTGGFINIIKNAPFPLPYEIYNKSGIKNPIVAGTNLVILNGQINSNTVVDNAIVITSGVLLAGGSDYSNSDKVVLQNNLTGTGNNTIQNLLIVT